jgi:hypothetical protein
MIGTTTAPIPSDWPTIDAAAGTTATAADVTARLARLDVAEIEPSWLPLLAAAAAELASVAGISWRFSTDDPAVALLRLIAKITLICPGASGTHTARLLAELR